MRADQVALLGALARRFPALRAALDEHLSDNEGEILPHLLMAEFERWARRALREGDPRLPEFLEALEQAYETGSEQVTELISVSFLEHLPRPGEPGSQIRDRLGPALQEQLEVIG